jgi:hypothetical protein
MAIWYIYIYGYLVHFITIRYILWPSGIFCGYSGIFAGYLVYFSRFGMFYQEKSGNPD